MVGSDLTQRRGQAVEGIRGPQGQGAPGTAAHRRGIHAPGLGQIALGEQGIAEDDTGLDAIALETGTVSQNHHIGGQSGGQDVLAPARGLALLS